MKNMKDDILSELLCSEGYVSGQALCEKYGVSRTAIWKVINALKEEGYGISSVNNRGYKITKLPDKLKEFVVKSMLTTERFGRKLDVLDEVDSTNNYCKKMAEEGAVEGYTVATMKQVAGRGRRGRVWETPDDTNIAFSLLLRPELVPNDASMITLLAALSVVSAVEELTGKTAQIKWPNDVIIGGRKVCGILTELSLELSAINYVVVGIGINVTNETMPEDIKDHASSILMETGVRVDKSELLGRILIHFEKYYDRFLVDKDLSGFKEMYENHLVNMNKTVRIIEGGMERTGVALGISERGALVVKFDTGVEQITGGEVSVRGIYGYV
ncbi:MAG: biotin--[acetyl-CoA-carboxylase] ligase [Lachnospiraceae bacterium]|nr:biotin--[acetyl-CoA-carboxylase] ligase [Lachnospiraceae bacterium]